MLKKNTINALCGFSLLLVLSLAPRGFTPGTPVFLFPQKPTFPDSNSTRNQVDEEPLCGGATCKSLFIYLFIYLFRGREKSAKAGKREGSPLPTLLNPPSLFPFLPIPYLFWSLLRRLVRFGHSRATDVFSKLQELQYYFPDNFRCNLKFYESKNFSRVWKRDGPSHFRIRKF